MNDVRGDGDTHRSTKEEDGGSHGTSQAETSAPSERPAITIDTVLAERFHSLRAR